MAAKKKAAKKKVAKNKVGRPGAFRPEFSEQAYKLTLLGATDKELGDFFNVSEQTINAWKKRYPEFLESTTRGKQIADANVAERFYRRAMGYTHPEEKIFQHNGRVIRAETTKHYPPDTQAASLWLRNRQPDKWRDKQDIDHGASNSLVDLMREIAGSTGVLDKARERSSNG